MWSLLRLSSSHVYYLFAFSMNFLIVHAYYKNYFPKQYSNIFITRPCFSFIPLDLWNPVMIKAWGRGVHLFISQVINKFLNTSYRLNNWPTDLNYHLYNIWYLGHHLGSLSFHPNKKHHSSSVFCLAGIIKSEILHRRTSMYKDPGAWAMCFVKCKIVG